MRLLLFAAAGQIPNAISVSYKTRFYRRSSSAIKAFLAALVFLNQAVNLIVFSALVRRPPENITQRVQPPLF